MRALSLCSGVGMLDLAMQWAGMEIAGQVEIDPWCRRVLAKHWPDVKRMADIKEVQGNEFGPVDLISGGIPCQPFSKSGELLGTADSRHLWPEARRIIAATQPTWVVIENVAHFLSMVLDLVQTDLESEGYEVWPAILPACAVDAPHIRERTAIVAHSLRQQPERERGSGAMGSATSCGGGDEEERQRLWDTTCHSGQEGMGNAYGQGIHAGKHGGGHETQIPFTDDACEDVANPANQRCQRNTQARWQTRRGTQYTSNVEYADSARWQELHATSGSGTTTGHPRRLDAERLQRLFESRICRDADGRSGGLDRVTRWPAYQGENQFDYEPPRTIPQRVKDHSRRLHALGNGVVPQVFYPIFAGIMLIESWNR